MTSLDFAFDGDSSLLLEGFWLFPTFDEVWDVDFAVDIGEHGFESSHFVDIMVI